ncbi:MAG TPA: DUF2148 domain-containing protein [Methanoregulaceae archaeon]|nr:DUF2148 domain-containing protein [Methanoregulaceae archaeon]
MTPEQDGVLTVAALMALAARTAPKGKGMDSIEIKVISGNDLGLLADAMKEAGTYHKLFFFQRDSKNVANSDACVLIGARGFEPVGINCRGCGHLSCSDMSDAFSRSEKAPFVFQGPNCSIKMADLGIAVGSAVKAASIHNVDNRVMYTAGIASLSLGWLGNCSVAYGIPLKASGKNIFFDRS